MRAPGRCQEAPGRAAVGKDSPAAIITLQHLAATRNCAAGCTENDGGAGTFRGVSWRREEEASLPIFLLFLCKILLPPLVKAPNRAVVPQPHGTRGHAEDREDAWAKWLGRRGDEMRWLCDIMGTLYPICKLKP